MNIIFSLVAAALLCAPLYVSAHSTGASWEQPVGTTYFIDVGYDPISITAGQSARFDFSLWSDTVKTKPAKFDEVWTRVVSQDKNTLLATGIRRQPLGPTTLLYTFEQGGSYSLQVSFRTVTGDEIAAAVFPFTVSQTVPLAYLFVIASGLLGALLGAFVLYLFMYRNK